MRGKNQEVTQQVSAGDIGVVAKLNVTGTGDTLCYQRETGQTGPDRLPQSGLQRGGHSQDPRPTWISWAHP